MVDHYYYYLVAVDSCANNISANGPIHAEVEIQGVAGNMRSILKWHPYLGFASKIYNVQRLIGGIWTTIGTVNNNDTNYVDLVNISCNINYYYRIQTVDLSAKGYVSLSDTLQVIPFDTVKPIAPLLKYVTVTSSNSVKVKWNLSSSGDVKFYEVHRISPLGVDSYVGTAIFTDTLIDNVVPAQQNSYCYYVIAIDSCNVANRSAPSNTLCTISIQVLLTPGCVPLSHINWTTCKSFDQLPIPNYEIWRTVNGGVWSKLKTVPATDTSYADSTVLLANVYCYVVRAFNASLTFATLSDTECVSPWLFPLQKAPELDVATVLKSGITNGQTVLRWKAIPISDTLTRGYRIYHSSTGVAGTFTLMADIGNRATTTFTQVNVNNYSSDNYYFMVAYDICNYNGDSSVVHKTVNISLARGNLSATISWNKYRGYNVKEYEILKSTNGITYSLLAITDSLTLTYRDTILSCGNRYWYRVKALENLGDNEISFSDVDSIIAYDSIPPPAIIIKQATVSGVGKVAGEISITYNASTELNRNGYKIYRSVNSAPYKLIGTNTNTSAGLLLYKDAGLNTLDSSYSYYIKVTDSCGNEGAASDIHTVVNVSAAAYNSANFVSWTAYVGFTNWHYEVERSSSVNPVWVSIGTFNHYILSIYDSATVCDVMYYYRVKTFDDLDVTASSISDTAGCLGFETNAPDSPVLLRATVNKSGKTTGEIQLDWKHSTSLDATNYLIYRRSNASIAWTFVTQTGYVNTYLDVNLNTTDSVYEYQMECLDNCRNIGAPNASHATINLSTVPGNTSAFLSWTKYIGFPVSRYEVYADGVLIASVPATQLNYQDSMLSCDTAVVYRIKALELNGNLQVSYSDTSSATPYDIIPPNPAYIIAVSVEQPENLVKVKWESIQEFNGKNVDLYRRKATESIWTKIYTSTSRYDTTYTDKGVNAGDTNIYYKITATDNCNNTSGFSKESKTILLRGTSDKLSHTLHWTNYELWNTGVRHYDIIKAEDNGLPYIVATVKSTDTVYVDNDLTTSIHNYCYHIQAHENPWKYYAVSNSNIVCLTQHPIIWIPTAFSPSTSTNLNDEFKPYGLYFSKYEEKIYNRWGELVFISTTHQPAWDGKFDGRYVPTGTFIYMITVTGYDGIEYKFKGPLNIVE